jgi:hypothetical protein
MIRATGSSQGLIHYEFNPEGHTANKEIKILYGLRDAVRKKPTTFLRTVIAKLFPISMIKKCSERMIHWHQGNHCKVMEALTEV